MGFKSIGEIRTKFYTGWVGKNVGSKTWYVSWFKKPSLIQRFRIKTWMNSASSKIMEHRQSFQQKTRFAYYLHSVSFVPQVPKNFRPTFVLGPNGYSYPWCEQSIPKNCMYTFRFGKGETYEKSHVMNGDEPWRFKIHETIQRYVPTLVSWNKTTTHWKNISVIVLAWICS